MHQYVVELGGFQPWMWGSFGDLKETHRRYVQQPDHWTLFFFEHDGILSVNNKPCPYRAGNIGFVTPGTKVQFQFTGPGTVAYQLTFGLTPRTETVVIPAVCDLGESTELRRQEFKAAEDWLHISIMRGLACAFNTLWSVAQPIGAFRKSDMVYQVEALIMSRLHTRIRICELASEVGLSHTHLLRLFREEHRCTVQQFIRDMRADIGRQLICDTSLSLKEIAVRVGCPDLQYFNKLIRVSSGMSPTSLREHATLRTRH